jgi:hypothetical protein
MIQKISRGKTSVSSCIHITKYDGYQNNKLLGDTEDGTENGTEDGTGTRRIKKNKEVEAPRPTEVPCPQANPRPL